MHALRPYQQRAVDAVIREWRTVPSTLLCMPTGTGKTVVFSHIAQRVEKRVLVLAHTTELVHQAADKLRRIVGEQHVGIEMAEHRADAGMYRPRIVVGTVQTHRVRKKQFDPSEFGAVVIDEAHRAAAASYRRILDHYCANPSLRVLGVTATPDRTDELALGELFATCAMRYSMPEAIADGWLCPVVAHPVQILGLDWSKARVTAGDLNERDVQDAMLCERVPQQIASTVLQNIGARRTLLFVPTVAVADALRDIINRHREGCARSVDGRTDKRQRAQDVADFAAGRFQVLVNCMVFTEGFDDPGIEVVAIARPTKSRALYAQMAGRGTRTLPGVVDGLPDAAARRAAIAASAKPSVELLDLRGNVGRHSLVGPVDVLSGIPLPELDREEIMREADAIVCRQGRGVTLEEAVEQAKEEVERRRRAAIAAKERAAQEERRRKDLRAQAIYASGGKVDPFGVTTGAKPGKWTAFEKPLTPKQRALLEKQGVRVDDMSPGDARRMVSEIIRRWDRKLCTYRQAQVLAKHGLPTEVSFEEASAQIERIKGEHRWGRAPAAPKTDLF